MPRWNEFNLRRWRTHVNIFEETPVSDTWFADPAELDSEILESKALTMLKVVCKLPPTPTQKEIQGET